MRFVTAALVALVLSAFAAHFALPAMSNEGALSGLEKPALIGIGAIGSIGYYMVARHARQGKVGLFIQAIIVGVAALYAALIGPFAFCIFFRAEAGCL